MSKTEISYRELMGKVSSELKKEADAAGEKFDVSKVAKAASARWSKIKDGKDPEFIQGKSAPVKRKSKKEKKHHTKEYHHHHHITAQTILDKVDLCDSCREKIQEFMTTSKNKFCKTSSKKTRKAKKGKKHSRKSRKAKKDVEEDIEDEEE